MDTFAGHLKAERLPWHSSCLPVLACPTDAVPTCQPVLAAEWAQIEDELQFVGKLARAYGQRLTFHPSHFVK